jgi:hypothetical protein
MVEILWLFFVMFVIAVFDKTRIILGNPDTPIERSHIQQQKKENLHRNSELTLPRPGFEPGLLRPQRRVLTTRRSRLLEIYILYIHFHIYSSKNHKNQFLQCK